MKAEREKERERQKGNLIMSTGFSLISLIFSPEKNFEENQERTSEERREGEIERKRVRKRENETERERGGLTPKSVIVLIKD